MILEFIVWLTSGPNGLDEFNGKIVDHRNRECHYFEEGPNGEIMVHSEVLTTMKTLTENGPCRRETALGDLLDLVSTRLLVVELGEGTLREGSASNEYFSTQGQARADSTELRKVLDSIIERGNQKQVYWLEDESNNDLL